MDTYNLVRHIVLNEKDTKENIMIIAHQVILGISPFLSYQNDKKTLFELAVDKRKYKFIELFILDWVKLPHWNMHNEIYKLEEKKDMKMIININNYVVQYKGQHPIINHLLTILYLAMIC